MYKGYMDIEDFFIAVLFLVLICGVAYFNIRNKKNLIDYQATAWREKVQPVLWNSM